MRHFHCRVGVRVAIMTAFAATTAFAEDAPTVSVHGVAFKQVAPTHVRVRFRVVAMGNSARSAMSKIEADRKELQTRLGSLKGNEPIVRLGGPFQLSKTSGEERMHAMDKRMHRFAFEVSLVWPLSADSAADRLLQIDETKEQLWKLQLVERDDVGKKENAGAKRDGDKSGDDSDAAGKRTVGADEESQMQLDAKPTLDFIYIGSESEWAELCKSAFAEAQRQARELASAAGRELGELHSISNYGPVHYVDVLSPELGSYYGEDRIRFFDNEVPNPLNATSDQLRQIQIRSSVYAIFRLN